MDENNLSAANQELQDLISVANFTNAEKLRFLSQIDKQLDSMGLTLDFLESRKAKIFFE